MNKEQIAEQIADDIYKSPSYRKGYGYVSLQDAALKALELAEQSAEKRLQEATQHQEARVKELEAERDRLRDAIKSALYGKPIDAFGNRDEDGLNGFPDISDIFEQLSKALREEELK